MSPKGCFHTPSHGSDGPGDILGWLYKLGDDYYFADYEKGNDWYLGRRPPLKNVLVFTDLIKLGRDVPAWDSVDKEEDGYTTFNMADSGDLDKFLIKASKNFSDKTQMIPSQKERRLFVAKFRARAQKDGCVFINMVNRKYHGRTPDISWILSLLQEAERPPSTQAPLKAPVAALI